MSLFVLSIESRIVWTSLLERVPSQNFRLSNTQESQNDHQAGPRGNVFEHTTSVFVVSLPTSQLLPQIYTGFSSVWNNVCDWTPSQKCMSVCVWITYLYTSPSSITPASTTPTLMAIAWVGLHRVHGGAAAWTAMPRLRGIADFCVSSEINSSELELPLIRWRTVTFQWYFVVFQTIRSRLVR